MGEAKLTSERWEARGLTIFKHGETALSICSVTQHQKKARDYARLIATAPELYEALKSTRNIAALHMKARGFSDADIEASFPEADEALAKAYHGET